MTRPETVTRASRWKPGMPEYDIETLELENSTLRAECERLKAERDAFYMDYRCKCDEETKRLHVEVERLRAEAMDVDAAREILARDAAFQEWAQGYLSHLWAGHDRADAVKQELLARETSVQALRKALEERSRQFHQAEQARTRGYVGMHGSWGGQVTTDWGACPSHPCCEDRKLLAGGEAATQEGKP